MPSRGRRILPALSLVTLAALSACATPQVAPVINVTPQGMSVNQSTPAQRMEDPMRNSSRNKIATLEQLREARSYKGSGTSSGDRLNAPALRENALRYGLQGGLAWGTRQVQALLRDRATELGRTYDFNALTRRSVGSDAIVLPPVLSEMIKPSEIQDGGRVLRVADTSYEMIQSAKLVERAPVWQSYLDMEACCGRSPDEPSEPLPRNDAERDLWRRYVTEGWNEGLVQAQDTFQAKLRVMQRDFTGMVRFLKLLDEGKVSDVVVAESSLGTTGTGQNMRVNDKVVRITRDARLNVGSGRDWKPAVGNVPVGEAAVPDGEPQPQPRTSEARRGGRIVPGSRPGRLPQAAPAPQESSAGMPETSTSRGY